MDLKSLQFCSTFLEKGLYDSYKNRMYVSQNHQVKVDVRYHMTFSLGLLNPLKCKKKCIFLPELPYPHKNKQNVPAPGQ